MPEGRFSDDRKSWWDGQQWMAATSDDGRWQWDGVTWQPIAGAAEAGGAPVRVIRATSDGNEFGEVGTPILVKAKPGRGGEGGRWHG